MHRIVSISELLIFLTIIFSCANASDSSIISFMKGDIQHSDDGAIWLNSKIGTQIYPGLIIKSGQNGMAEVILAGGAMLRIRPNTVITMPKGTGNSPVRFGFVRMLTGKIWSQFKGNGDFEIETPNAVAGIRGTIFTLEYNNSITKLSVIEGKMHFAAISKGMRKRQILVEESFRSFAQDEKDVSEPQYFDIKMEKDEWLDFENAVKLGLSEDEDTEDKNKAIIDEEKEEIIDGPGASKRDYDAFQDGEMSLLSPFDEIEPMNVLIISPPPTPLDIKSEIRGMVTNRTQIQRVEIDQNPNTKNKISFLAGINGNTFEYPVNLLDGDNVFRITITDKAGKKATVGHRVYFHQQIFAPASLKITGRVVDSMTGKAISGAVISVAGTNLTGISNSEGRFEITGLSPGNYTIIIARDGYIQGILTNISVKSENNSIQDTRLDAVPRGR